MSGCPERQKEAALPADRAAAAAACPATPHPPPPAVYPYLCVTALLHCSTPILCTPICNLHGSSTTGARYSGGAQPGGG